MRRSTTDAVSDRVYKAARARNFVPLTKKAPNTLTTLDAKLKSSVLFRRRVTSRPDARLAAGHDEAAAVTRLFLGVGLRRKGRAGARPFGVTPAAWQLQKKVPNTLKSLDAKLKSALLFRRRIASRLAARFAAGQDEAVAVTRLILDVASVRNRRCERSEDSMGGG